MAPLRMAAYLFLLVMVSITINLLQFWAPFLILPFSRHQYRRWMSYTESLFGALIVLLTRLFCPLTLRISAESKETWEQMSSRDLKNVLIANHQALVDWWYLWIIAHREGKHGDFKIILKESLKYLPIFGWGMYFFEFIFLKRKWSFDKKVLENATKTIQKDAGLPCWLLIFPEGTVNDPPGVNSSKSYAKKIDLPYPYDHVMLPKSTGLFFILRHLADDVPALYDITFAYPQGKHKLPFDDFPIDKVFFDGQGPKFVDMHLRRFPISEVPGISSSWKPPAGFAEAAAANAQLGKGEFETDPVEKARHEAFTLWLRDRFLEKDKLMAHYFEHGKFPDAVPRVENLQVTGAGPVEKRHTIEVFPNPTFWDLFSMLGSTIVSHYIMWTAILALKLSLKSVLITLAITGAIVFVIFVATGTIHIPGINKKSGAGTAAAQARLAKAD